MIPKYNAVIVVKGNSVKYTKHLKRVTMVKAFNEAKKQAEDINFTFYKTVVSNVSIKFNLTK